MLLRNHRRQPNFASAPRCWATRCPSAHHDLWRPPTATGATAYALNSLNLIMMNHVRRERRPLSLHLKTPAGPHSLSPQPNVFCHYLLLTPRRSYVECYCGASRTSTDKGFNCSLSEDEINKSQTSESKSDEASELSKYLAYDEKLKYKD